MLKGIFAAWYQLSGLSFTLLWQDFINIPFYLGGEFVNGFLFFFFDSELPWYQSGRIHFLYAGLILLLIYLIVVNRKLLSYKIWMSSELEQSQQTQNFILSNSPMIFIMLDKSFTILGFEGQSAKEVLQQVGRIPSHIDELIPGFTKLPAIQRAINGFTENISLPIQNKVFECNIIPRFSSKQKVIGMDVICFDVTPRIIAEKEIVNAKEQAENANRLKSAFLANMSHELRTPLNAILGFTNILSLQNQNEAVRKKYLHTIRASGEHLLRTINEILDLSKIESGKMDLFLEETNLWDMMANIDSMLQVEALKKGLLYESFMNTNVPKYIITDPKRMRQILLNVVGNAIKYTQTGSVKVSVNADLRDRKLLFTIEVSGLGISEEQLSTIFQPFKQINSMYSNGTGLGLSIANSLTQLMNGDIQVDSEPNVGSVFKIKLPYTDSEHQDLVRIEMSDEDLVRSYRVNKGTKALIVDDKKESRELLHDYLSYFGFTVELAGNGEEAIRATLKTDFNLILMDIYMPVLDGIQAMKLIKDKNPDAKIVAVSAGGLNGFEKEMKDLGFADFLHKPFKDIQLVKLLKSLICDTGETIKLSVKSAIEKEEVSFAHLKVAFLEYLNSIDKNEKEKILEAIDVFDFDFLNLWTTGLPDTFELKDIFVKKTTEKDFSFLIQLSEI